MSLDLSALDNAPRLLFAIPLKPMQGSRFQPTGFPNLGAATFRTAQGESLLVESAQSMANHIELTVWDEATQNLKPDFAGLSHVRVLREGKFLTDSILESHRLNSPYVLDAQYERKEGDNVIRGTYFEYLHQTFANFDTMPVDRHVLVRELLDRDIGSLIHGVFLSQPRKKVSLAGGRLRLARALSAFIEADGVRVAASGGAKHDRVNPSWPREGGYRDRGYGHTPFARDEFTAERITLYANVDLAQIRGYGLDDAATQLLILLALYKLRALVDGDLRLRTACEFEIDPDAPNALQATRPVEFVLPAIDELLPPAKAAISAVGDAMQVTEVSFNDKLVKGKDDEAQPDSDGGDGDGDTSAKE